MGAIASKVAGKAMGAAGGGTQLLSLASRHGFNAKGALAQAKGSGFGSVMAAARGGGNVAGGTFGGPSGAGYNRAPRQNPLYAGNSRNIAQLKKNLANIRQELRNLQQNLEWGKRSGQNSLNYQKLRTNRAQMRANAAGRRGNNARLNATRRRNNGRGINTAGIANKASKIYENHLVQPFTGGGMFPLWY